MSERIREACEECFFNHVEYEFMPVCDDSGESLEPHFSRAWCDYCVTSLAGNRFKVVNIERVLPHELSLLNEPLTEDQLKEASRVASIIKPAQAGLTK